MPWFFPERRHPGLYMRGNVLLCFSGKSPSGLWGETAWSFPGRSPSGLLREDALDFLWEKWLRSLTEGRQPGLSLGEVPQVSNWGEMPWFFSGRCGSGLWLRGGSLAFLRRSCWCLWLRGNTLVFLWEKLLVSLTSGKTLVIPGRGRPTHCLRGDDLVFLWEKSLRSLTEGRCGSGLWLRGDTLVFLWEKLLGSLTRGKALAIPRSRPTCCLRGDALVFLWEKSLRCL